MFNEELKKEIISCFEDRGFVFDYEEDEKENEIGGTEKRFYFWIELEGIRFSFEVDIEWHPESSFLRISYRAKSFQLMFNELEPDGYLDVLEKINVINRSTGANGGCCDLFGGNGNCYFPMLIGGCLLPNYDYEGMLEFFVYTTKYCIEQFVQAFADQA